MWKKKKVKAGVLLYAVTVAAIFSLLLQFYLNRQVAHYQDYALNKEKLIAFAMAKRTKDKVEQDHQHLHKCESFNLSFFQECHHFFHFKNLPPYFDTWA